MNRPIDRKRRLLLAGCAAAGMGVLAIAAAQEQDANAPGDPAERVIRVTARRFEFSPSVIPLQKGVPVVFELISLDIMMGFSVPDFNVRSDVLPEQVSRLRLVPDKSGEFVFYCDIFCGLGHESMSGSLVVS